MSIYACKLPNGLTVDTRGETIVLFGTNIGEEVDNPSKNGMAKDSLVRVHGYGLTTLNDKQSEAFEAWRKEVTEKDGKPIPHGFPAFGNGAILGPFKSEADARKEAASMAGIVDTGFNGVDTEAEAKKKGGVQKKED